MKNHTLARRALRFLSPLDGDGRERPRAGRPLRMERLEHRELLAVSPQQLLALPPALPANESYSFSVLAKAKPDEWFTGTEDAQGKYTSGPYYALGTQPANVAGREKVNQDYVWGMAEANGKIFFSSSGNVLAGASGAIGAAGTQGYMDGIHVSEGAQVQYPTPIAEELQPILGDRRPPQMHVYDTATATYTNITPNDARLNDTLGLRSVGANDTIVLYAGPQLTYLGMNVFAFNAKTLQYLGSRTVLAYSNVRDWVNVNGQLYTACDLSTTGEGSVLRWSGTLSSPFSFQEVARLDAEAANIAVHNNRLFVGTWPQNYGSLMGYLGYRSNATASIWMSPTLTSTGRLNTGSWQKVWNISDYEVDPIVAKSIGMGAMASFDGYLYFGTMQVPGTGDVVLREAYPTYKGSTGNTYRALALFRGKDFTVANPDVQLLYGDNQLPKFTPPADVATQTGVWTLIDNNTGPALLGRAGIDNAGNTYTWSMAVANNRLYVGTFDVSTVALGDYYITYNGDPVALEISARSAVLGTWMGADLYEFFPDAGGQPVQAFPVSKTGAGNPLNHGIRNMSSLGGTLYMGTANASNILTENNNALLYPGKNLQAGGWELVKLNVGTSPGSIPFTLTGSTVAEKNPATRANWTRGTLVGTLAVTSPDSAKTYTFSLLDDAAGRFQLTGNKLEVGIGSLLDYETMATHQIVARVTDNLGNSTNQVFAITLTDVGEAPLRINTTGTWVEENSPGGTVVATLTPVDLDAGNTVSMALVNNAGGRFTLEGNVLKVAPGAVLDYEAAKTHTITVRATDSTTLTRDVNFTIQLIDDPELPVPVISSFDVQRGAVQRSYIRYVDVVFADAAGVADLLTSGRVQLRRFGLSGTGTATTVSLTGRLSTSGNKLQLNFGSAGLTTNGYYELSLDLDGDGTREAKRYFYRLLGDVNGDHTANAVDRSLVQAAMGRTGTNLNEDVNGDGRVSYLDRLRIATASGSLATGLWLDD